MMNRILLMFLLLLGTCVSAQESADECPIFSEVKEVTVYREGAQVTRSATLDLRSGRHELVFGGLPLDVLENSLRVTSSDTSLVILGVRHRIRYAEPRESTEDGLDRSALLEELAGGFATSG